MSDQDNLMSEVEQEIFKILNNNKQSKINENSFCNRKNLGSCLKQLAQEFDYFDVSSLEEPFDLTNSTSLKNILVQLVNSSYNLVKLHQDVLRQQDLNFEKNCRLSSDYKALTKNVESLRRELTSKDKQILLNKEKLCLEKIERDQLKQTINLTKKEMNVIKKESVSEKSRHQHELQKIVSDSKKLEEKFRKNCGVYTSGDQKVLTVIDEYKKNEEKYQDMIAQLQKNNHELLEEILSLKESFSEALHKLENRKSKK